MEVGTITKKRRLAYGVHEFWVYHPHIAKRAKAGQFFIVRVHDKSERIPLTIAGVKGDEFRMVVRAVGKSTYEMCAMKEGDKFHDIVGPLGQPSEIKKYGNVLVMGGGVGIATIYPIIKELKEVGNRVEVILAARSAEFVILKDEIEAIADKVYVATDDGSMGFKGLVTDLFKKLLDEGNKYDVVWSVGPTIMMKFTSLIAKEYDIPIWVSINSIMVDGTGMCGACRVHYKGQMKFACVDGPEFDGRYIEWDDLLRRMTFYREEEKEALERYLAKVGEPTWL